MIDKSIKSLTDYIAESGMDKHPLKKMSYTPKKRGVVINLCIEIPAGLKEDTEESAEDEDGTPVKGIKVTQTKRVEEAE